MLAVAESTGRWRLLLGAAACGELVVAARTLSFFPWSGEKWKQGMCQSGDAATGRQRL